MVIEGCKSPYCLKCDFNGNQKCRDHYDKMISSEIDKIVVCPYGYCSISTNKYILSGIKVQGIYDSKKIESNKRLKDNSSCITEFEMQAIVNVIMELESDAFNKHIYVQTIHDIKKANSTFADTLDIALKKDEYKQDQILRDLLDGLDFISTRLDYHDFVLGRQNNLAFWDSKLDLVSIGVKISKMLKYKTEPRGIKINNSKGQFLNVCTIADSKLIYVLFFVLLENAVKYSTNGSTIMVTYYDYDLESTAVEFKNSIEKPLSQQDINNIFEFGYRGSNVNEESGGGVGMSVVKNVIDRYGYKYILPKADTHEYSFTIIFPKPKTIKK